VAAAAANDAAGGGGSDDDGGIGDDGDATDLYYATKGQGAGARRTGAKSNSVKQSAQRGAQMAKRAAQRE